MRSLLLLVVVAACSSKPDPKAEACRAMRHSAAKTAKLAIKSAQATKQLPEPFERLGQPAEDTSDEAFVDTVQATISGLQADNMDATIAADKARQTLGPESARVFEALAVALDGEGDYAPAWAAAQAQLKRYDDIVADQRRKLDELSTRTAEAKKRIDARIAGGIQDPLLRNALDKQLKLLDNQTKLHELQRGALDLDAYDFLKHSMTSIEQLCTR
ncbi:MAG: hypothetical protein SFX73_26760 [Kofleriaceae bacterium]|nr:hypothetical protein [Kofleriaceae bacterium]